MKRKNLSGIAASALTIFLLLTACPTDGGGTVSPAPVVPGIPVGGSGVYVAGYYECESRVKR